MHFCIVFIWMKWLIVSEFINTSQFRGDNLLILLQSLEYKSAKSQEVEFLQNWIKINAGLPLSWYTSVSSWPQHLLLSGICVGTSLWERISKQRSPVNRTGRIKKYLFSSSAAEWKYFNAYMVLLVQQKEHKKSIRWIFFYIWDEKQCHNSETSHNWEPGF